MKNILAFAAILLVVGGFTYLGNERQDALPVAGEYNRYFSTPAHAVKIVTGLLEAEDWATLATYYDLTGTELSRSDLSQATFFLETEQPESVHPAGFWRYKQPFAPGFAYQSFKSLANDEVEVTVVVEIEQGEGLIQKGLDTFRLKAHPEGYQLRPKD